MAIAPASVDIERQLRDGVPAAIGVLVRRGTRFADAEDAVQDAVTIALETWPERGIPDHPIGWLVRVAQRRVIARHRSDTARHRREQLVISWSSLPAEPASTDDDSLTLLFLCCHPALPVASAIALTLRAVGGLTTREIASGLLQSEATVAQRISRAKATISRSNEPFRRPTPGQIDGRLPGVLHTIYLIFNEGHAASSGPILDRPDLAAEALRLARNLHQALPPHAEATGLLALLLLTHARQATRTNLDGELVPLDRQDRRVWNRPMITEGLRLLTTALGHHQVGDYQLQAAIAAVHDEAPTYAETNWQELRALYNILAARRDNPIVRLNRAIAIAHTDGPEQALREIDDLADRLADHHRYHAALGYLHDLVGDRTTARGYYAQAARLATNEPERRYLRRKACS